MGREITLGGEIKVRGLVKKRFTPEISKKLVQTGFETIFWEGLL